MEVLEFNFYTLKGSLFVKTALLIPYD